MRIALAAAVLGLAAVAAPALAHMPGGLEVVRPWSRPAAAGMNTAGFMTIQNHGRQPQTLVRVESAAARKAELHQTVVTDGIARMEPVAALTIPPGGEVKLEPGGRHLMLVGLARPLAAGQRVTATLVFESGVKVKAEMTAGSGPPPQGPRSIHNH